MLGAKRLWSLLCMFGMIALARATTVPTLTGPIMDTAEMLDEATKNLLETQVLALQEETGAQVAVLTVPSLDDESIEDFSMRVVQTWKLGQKDADNGVLLTIALEERSVRIEVGYGLEGTLTDTKCGVIIRNFITPYFKDGDYNAGVQNGVNAIVGVIIEDDALNEQIEALIQNKNNSRAPILIPIAMFGTFFLIVGASVRYGKKHGTTSTPQSSQHVTSHGGGHSGNHEHTSHGGYSGGGGGFGGGGASGRW